MDKKAIEHNCGAQDAIDIHMCVADRDDIWQRAEEHLQRCRALYALCGENPEAQKLMDEAERLLP